MESVFSGKSETAGTPKCFTFSDMPTSSTSIIAGTRRTDPIKNRYFSKKENGLMLRVAPEFKETFGITKMHYIDQKWSVRACECVSAHIDQAQSMNLYIT